MRKITRKQVTQRIERIAKPGQPLPARYGLADGTIETGKLYEVWVTYLDGSPVKALNYRMPANWGDLVLVGYDQVRYPTRLQVLSFWDVYPDAPWDGTPAHSPSQQWPSPDTLWVLKEQFLPGLVVPIAGTLTVSVYPAAALGTTAWKAPLAPETFDYSASVPVSGALYGLLVRDATGALVLREGAAVAAKADLVDADIPLPESGDQVLFALKLWAGMEELSKTAIVNDLVDLRGAHSAYPILPDGSISLAQMADAPALTVIGNNDPDDPAVPQYLTVAEIKEMQLIGGLETSITPGETVTIASAGSYTVTVPESMTLAGRDVANTFTANQTIASASPILTLTDTTVSAKSLAIALDNNAVQIRESGGAAGSFVVLDLVNLRLGVGVNPSALGHFAKSSDSGSSTGYPAVIVQNTLETIGNGTSTYNRAEMIVNAGGNTVSGRLSAIYESAFAGMAVGTTTGHPFSIYTAGAVNIRITVSATGNVGIGATPLAKLDVAGQDGTEINIRSFSDVAGTRAVFKGRKAGGTLASPTNVTASNDYLFSILGDGYFGDTYRSAVSIDLLADGAWATNSYPTQISFWTNNSSTTRTERMRLNALGNLLINNTAIVAKLAVQGDTNAITSILRAPATGTANITEWQLSGGTVVSSVSSVGYATFAGVGVGSANYYYWGDPSTDGTYRIGRAGNNLEISRRESGSYVTKQVVTA